MQTEQGKNCSVRILSRTDGKQSMYTAVGILRQTPSGIFLQYKQANSLVTLEAERETVRMLREGDLYIRLCFLPKNKTQGRLGLSAQDAGEVSVYTERAELIRFENGEDIKMILDYVLRFPDGAEQRVSLQLFAGYKE